MGTDLTSVDLTTLSKGTVVRVELDNGSILPLMVEDPASGAVSIHIAGKEPISATFTNEHGLHLLGVGDDLKFDDESTSRKVASLQVMENAKVFELRIKGATPEEVDELLGELGGIEGLAFTSRKRVDVDPE